MKKSKKKIINSSVKEVSQEVFENISTNQALLMLMKTKVGANSVIRLHIKEPAQLHSALRAYAEDTGEYSYVLNYIREAKKILENAEDLIEYDLQTKSKLN